MNVKHYVIPESASKGDILVINNDKVAVLSPDDWRKFQKLFSNGTARNRTTVRPHNKENVRQEKIKIMAIISKSKYGLTTHAMTNLMSPVMDKKTMNNRLRALRDNGWLDHDKEKGVFKASAASKGYTRCNPDRSI